MRIIEPNAIIQHIGKTIRGWGRPNPYGVNSAGGVFEYYEEINRRGNFKTPDGLPVVLDTAELRLALDLSEAQ